MEVCVCSVCNGRDRRDRTRQFWLPNGIKRRARRHSSDQALESSPDNRMLCCQRNGLDLNLAVVLSRVPSEVLHVLSVRLMSLASETDPAQITP